MCSPVRGRTTLDLDKITKPTASANDNAPVARRERLGGVQRDFVFEGKGGSFDEALQQAFDDLAVAYPKGLVAIEAEQIKDGALTSPEGVAGPENRGHESKSR
jgi:hypothetical protein